VNNEAWPESKWTPFQRQWMHNEEIGRIRQLQQVRLLGWADRQRRTREWICFADVADWCARQPGRVARDEEQRAQAGTDLLRAIVGGEFNRDGRLCVAYVPPYHFICPEPIKVRFETSKLCSPVPIESLACLWAPRDLSAKWLMARGIELPPWLTPVTPAPLATSDIGVEEPADTSPEPQKPAPTEFAPGCYRTGAPGRPPSIHLVKAEMKRRAETGTMLLGSCAKEAKALASWHKTEHEPFGSAPIMPKTIQNQLGKLYRQLSQNSIPK
jgi:hypothetical protein